MRKTYLGRDDFGSRRGFLALVGATAGGLATLTGCKDDVVGSEVVPTTAQTTGTPTTLPTAYTPTDADRMNFTLQLHYLLAAYLQTALTGSGLPADLTTGSGNAGQVSGGRQVSFSSADLAATVREVAGATSARIAFLRRSLGSAATAQPAIAIGGGQTGPFQAIAQLKTAPAPASFFDPYASDADFLLGAVALFSVATSAVINLTWSYPSALRGPLGALSTAVAANDAVFRNALFTLAAQEPVTSSSSTTSLFARASAMSDGRDQFDGPGDRDLGLGSASKSSISANVGSNDSNSIAIRRTPEQALGVLYATTSVASSGGFFPAGLNGTIRMSGLNS